MRKIVLLPLLLLFATSGCLNLDFMVHNPIHCSKVTDATCKTGNVWDRACKKCDQPYDWAQNYEWFEQTLKAGQTIRPIDSKTVKNYKIKTIDKAATLDAYFIPAHGENKLLSKTTVLFNHGNYMGIEHYMPRIRMLHEAGYNVFAWDYRGYGKSEPASAPTPQEFLADARQVRDYVATLKDIPDASKVILYANSLGGIPAMEQAVHKAGCALFYEAGFTYIRGMTRAASTANIPEGFFSQGYFNQYEKIKKYKGPFLSMIGTIDVRFSVREQQDLVDNATGPKELWILEGVNHGIANIGIPEASWENYTNKMLEFLKKKAPACLNQP